MDFTSPPSRNKKLYVVGGIVVFGIILLLAGFFSAELTTKVAPGKKFKVLGPKTIVAGRTATITWDASPENAKRFPTEKIEYCVGTLKPKCVLLAAAAPNNGKATVKVPARLPGGKGYLKFTARDPNRRLLATFTANSGAVTAQPAPAPSGEGSAGDSGGGGGGGGGGGSNGGSNEQPKAPGTALPPPIVLGAEFVAPVDNETILAGESLDVRVKLTETDTSKLVCQEWLLDGKSLTTANWAEGQSPQLSTIWEGGQSPDLSAEPCQ